MTGFWKRAIRVSVIITIFSGIIGIIYGSTIVYEYYFAERSSKPPNHELGSPEVPDLDLEYFAFAPGFDSAGKSIYNQTVVGPAIIKVSDSANDIVVLGLGVRREGLSGVLWQFEANCPYKAERGLKANYPSPLGQVAEYFFE